MFRKLFFAALFGSLALPSFACAHDGHYLVHYECDTVKNTLTARTMVSGKSAWQWDNPGDDLSFEWLAGMGRPLECVFSTGDTVFVKPYYGNYGKVAVYINRTNIDPVMVFDAANIESFQIQGEKDHVLTVKYTNEILSPTPAAAK